MAADVFETRTLTEVDFPLVMNSSDHNLIPDFFVPLLSRSRRYDRGIGYFSSGWLRIASKGVKSIAERGGKIRWVMSPLLAEEEWNTIRRGEEAKIDPVVRKSIRDSIEELKENLEENTLTALAWMIADEIVHIRLAIPRGKLNGGDFHDKFGIFTDADGNQVAFSGSYNETVKGVLNYESIKTFPSWKAQFHSIVESEVKRFERLWDDKDPNVKVFTVPESIKEDIVRLRKDKPRPYSIPTKREVDRIPNWVKPISFQEEAIESWFDSSGRGILEMATGTGKTIVALKILCRYLKNKGRAAIVITTPFKHLVKQWEDVSRSFGFDPISCFGSRHNWEDEANNEIVKFNLGSRDELLLISTHSTFTLKPMQNAIGRIKRDNTVLIADEVHHLGSKKYKTLLPENLNARLGLSATPRRWHDPEGTEKLMEYFGGVVFKFPLKKAIREECLCPYEYRPHLVDLTESEIQDYRDLTDRIAHRMAVIDEEEWRDDEKLTILLNERANIIKKAENKLNLVRKLVKENQDLDHALFYCAPDQKDQFKEVLRILGEENILAKKFYAETSDAERAKLLKDLGKGRIDALVAMGCLDEGVDVPSVKTAYFLASSSNPLQFIQRRGRVLRKSKDKDRAIVHDFIIVPYLENPKKHFSSKEFSSERKIIKREFRRFKEFADAAENKFKATEHILPTAKAYNILDF